MKYTGKNLKTVTEKFLILGTLYIPLLKSILRIVLMFLGAKIK